MPVLAWLMKALGQTGPASPSAAIRRGKKWRKAHKQYFWHYMQTSTLEDKLSLLIASSGSGSAANREREEKEKERDGKLNKHHLMNHQTSKFT